MTLDQIEMIESHISSEHLELQLLNWCLIVIDVSCWFFFGENWLVIIEHITDEWGIIREVQNWSVDLEYTR